MMNEYEKELVREILLEVQKIIKAKKADLNEVALKSYERVSALCKILREPKQNTSTETF